MAEPLKVAEEALKVTSQPERSSCCPFHPSKELSAYCDQCEELICGECAGLKHESPHYGHAYDFIDQTFPKHRDVIVSNLQQVKQHLATVGGAIQDLGARSKKIEDQRKTIEDDIHKQIDSLNQSLEQRRKELIDQLHQHTQQKLKALAAQRDQCQLIQTELISCQDDVENSLKTGSKVEILAMKPHAIHQIKRITTKFEDCKLVPTQEADIQLLTDKMLHLQISCQGFAEIVTGDSICCSKSFATGDGLQTATDGEEATVTLHARDKEERECDGPLQDVSGSLVCTKDGNTVKCDIMREKKSTYTVSYRPKIRGRHKLYLKINGGIVKGSPHTVIVTPRLKDLGNPVKDIRDLNRPWGVTTDSKGRIIVTESSGNCVSIFSPEGEKIQSLPESGSLMKFNYPTGVTVDDEDSIYVVDYWNHRIQKFSSDGNFVSSIGNEGSKSLQFSHPHDIGFNKKNGRLYVCDQVNQRIQILTKDLKYHSSFGSEGNEDGQFTFPHSVAFDRSGHVYITDDHNHTQVFSPDGEYKRKLGSKVTSCGELFQPMGTGVAVDGNRVYVTKGGGHHVSVFSTEDKFLKSFGGKGKAKGEFQHPRSVNVNKDGFILIADTDNDRIQVF